MFTPLGGTDDFEKQLKELYYNREPMSRRILIVKGRFCQQLLFDVFTMTLNQSTFVLFLHLYHFPLNIQNSTFRRMLMIDYKHLQ